MTLKEKFIEKLEQRGIEYIDDNYVEIEEEECTSIMHFFNLDSKPVVYVMVILKSNGEVTSYKYTEEEFIAQCL